MHGDWDVSQSHQRKEWCIRCVKDERNIRLWMQQCVKGRQKSVAQRLHRFEANRWQMNEFHTQVAIARGPMCRSAINDHSVATPDEPPTDFVDRSFESAVGGGHSSGPQHRYLQRGPVPDSGWSSYPFYSPLLIAPVRNVTDESIPACYAPRRTVTGVWSGV